MKPHSETGWATKYPGKKIQFGSVHFDRAKAVSLATAFEPIGKVVRVRITELKRERKRK